jgi:hypothetical protein
VLPVALLLPACDAPPAADRSANPPADTSGDTTSDPGVTPPDPAWTADEVEVRLNAGISLGFPDPFHPIDVYADLLRTGGTYDCPGTGDLNLEESFSGCTASTGYLFAGQAYWTGSVEGDRDVDLKGDCYIIDPDGNWFVGGGELAYAETTADGTHTWSAEVAGTWGYPLSEGWTAETPSVALFYEGSEGAEATLRIEGGYARPDAQMYFDGVAFGECGDAPTGAVRLRDPTGYWYTVTFDGCTGCGPVTFEGEELGEACVDLTAAAAGLTATLGPA